MPQILPEMFDDQGRCRPQFWQTVWPGKFRCVSCGEPIFDGDWIVDLEIAGQSMDGGTHRHCLENNGTLSGYLHRGEVKAIRQFFYPKEPSDDRN